MMAIVKHIAAQILSVASVIVFIISLCSIGSGWLPVITLFASEAWIIGYILRDREVTEDDYLEQN